MLIMQQNRSGSRLNQHLLCQPGIIILLSLSSISGERQKVRQKAVSWPCGVYSKGVGSNSLQCTSCQKWVHRKCSGIKGSMLKVAKSFLCRGCLNPVTSAGRNNNNDRLTAFDPGQPG